MSPKKKVRRPMPLRQMSSKYHVSVHKLRLLIKAGTLLLRALVLEGSEATLSHKRRLEFALAGTPKQLRADVIKWITYNVKAAR